MFFHFFVSSSISFTTFLQFSAYRSLTSLVRVIPRYFIILGAVVNGISFFICLSVASLLAYMNATDFCTLTLYPATLLNSCISFGRLLEESVGFSIYNIMSSAKSESLTSSLPIFMPLISFCCLIVDASISNTMLSNNDESGHPCHVSDLRRKALSFSPLRMMLAVGFS
uniref:Uncharacterized protein n=1 Tax=Felis catus TaxID=9685 RepID=A0ABI7VWL4_FELCA